MEDGLQVLKEIGAQQIHKDTHISKEYVQAMIHGSFDGLHSVQFKGFASILEREYGVDLSELKREAQEYFREENEELEASKKVFVTPQKQESNSSVYIILGILLVGAMLYYTFGYLSSMSDVEQQESIKKEDTKKIATPIESLELDKTLTTVSENKIEMSEEVEAPIVSDVIEEKVEAVEVVEVQEEIIPTAEPKEEVIEKVQSLKILPKRKIWAGYINIKTNQKYQKVFRKEYALNTSKDWLLLFGAGTVYLEVNGEKQKFSSKLNMRFKYVDGTFTKISLAEFKSLNKGRKW